jgi:hypothetical protein
MAKSRAEKSVCGRVARDRILESAVILSWKDLVHPPQRGSIHIEYAAGLASLFEDLAADRKRRIDYLPGLLRQLATRLHGYASRWNCRNVSACVNGSRCTLS